MEEIKLPQTNPSGSTSSLNPYAAASKGAFARLRGNVGAAVARQIARCVIENTNLLSVEDTTLALGQVTRQYAELAADLTMPYKQRKEQTARLADERARLLAMIIILVKKHENELAALEREIADNEVSSPTTQAELPICDLGCRCTRMCVEATEANNALIVARTKHERGASLTDGPKDVLSWADDMNDHCKDMASLALNVVMPRRSRMPKIEAHAARSKSLEIEARVIVACAMSRSRSAEEYRDLQIGRKKSPSTTATRTGSHDVANALKKKKKGRKEGGPDVDGRLRVVVVPDKAGREKLCRDYPNIFAAGDYAVETLSAGSYYFPDLNKHPMKKVLVISSMKHYPRTARLVGVYAIRGLFNTGDLPGYSPAHLKLRWDSSDDERTRVILADCTAVPVSSPGRARDERAERGRKLRGRRELPSDANNRRSFEKKEKEHRARYLREHQTFGKRIPIASTKKRETVVFRKPSIGEV